MLNQSNQTHLIECKFFSFKPVIVGALMIIGLSFLLNLFSLAIGLTAFTTNSEGVENIALGGLIATALGVVVSMFASGWVAGYLARRHCHTFHLGALYGFLAWCLALIVMVFLAEYFAKYVTFYTHFISGTTSVTAANATITATMPNTPAAQNPLVISTYVVFSLFFLSAFASSIGGHCGMRHCCKKEQGCE